MRAVDLCRWVDVDRLIRMESGMHLDRIGVLVHSKRGVCARGGIEFGEGACVAEPLSFEMGWGMDIDRGYDAACARH